MNHGAATISQVCVGFAVASLHAPPRRANTRIFPDRFYFPNDLGTKCFVKWQYKKRQILVLNHHFFCNENVSWRYPFFSFIIYGCLTLFFLKERIVYLSAARCYCCYKRMVSKNLVALRNSRNITYHIIFHCAGHQACKIS